MKALLLILIVFASGTVRAQDAPDIPFIPKPRFEICHPEYRCLDAESYALVLSMRSQYVFLHEAYTIEVPYMFEKLKEESDALRAAADVEKARADKNMTEYNELEKRYIKLLDKKLDPGWLELAVRAWPLIAVGTLVGAVGAFVFVTLQDDK